MYIKRHKRVDSNIQVISMTTQLKRKIPFVLMCVVSFYFFPLFGDSTGSFMAILLFIIPLVTLITSLLYGLKIGMDLYFPLLIGVLFVPTIFIYYNSTAWVYTIGYAIISLIGVFIGDRMNVQ